MAFNVGDFVKDTAKSALTKLVDNVVGNIVSGLPMNTKLIADSTATSLINIGAAYNSVEAFSSMKTDSIVSGGDNAFFAVAGKAVNRASASIESLRRTSVENTSTYLAEINPETKIASKRSKDEFEVLSIL